MADNIKTYTNTERAPQADSRAASSQAASGRAWQGAFNTIGESVAGGEKAVEDAYVKHEAMKDTSNNSKAGADAFANLSNGLSQAAALAQSDPQNSDKHWDDFKKNMEDQLAKIGADNSTDAGAENAQRIGATLRNTFSQQVIGAKSTIAGRQMVTNLEQTKNGLAQAVSNNPTLLTSAINMLKGTMEDQLATHNLTPEQQAKVRDDFTNPAMKDLAVAAFHTMADRDPAAAREALKRGEFAGIFDGSDINSLNNYAESMTRAQTEQQRSAAAEARRAAKENFDKAVNNVTAQTVNADTGQLQLPADYFKSVIALKNLDQADDGTIRAMLSMGRTVTDDIEKGTPVVTDPHTYEDFSNRAFLGESDPRKLSTAEVLQARAAHLLSDKDYTFWNSAVNELSKDETKSASAKDFNKFLDSYKGYITGSSFLKVDAYGDQKNYEWRARAQQMHDQMKAAKVPEDDIRKAIVAVLPQYQVSKETAAKSFSLKATTGLKPLPAGGTEVKREPGESPAAFLKRTGG